MANHSHGIPGPVLIDGCLTCHELAAKLPACIAMFDRNHFVNAWSRAARLHMFGDMGGMPPQSSLETPLLDLLWAFQVQIQALGWPIGHVPIAPTDADVS